MTTDSPDPTAPDPATDPGAVVDPLPVAPDPAPQEPDPVPLAPDPVAPGATPGGQTGSLQRRNRLLATGAIAFALVVALAAGFTIGRATAPVTETAVVSSPSAGTSPATASPRAGVTAGLPSDGTRLGSPDATVVIDYWADYQCPFCSKFAEEVIPALESRIADGTVALVHRDFAFLGTESTDAAVAVRCAAREDRYWAMHDAVYAAQQGENQGAFARPRLAAIAAGIGLDAGAFETCMDEHGPLVEVLDDTAAGVRSGITSTPTVDVNGTRFPGVSDVPAFLAAVDAAVAGASPAPLPTAQPSTDPWSATQTDGRTAGRADAPVTVELWMDYQSTDSAIVANELGPELRTRLDAGAIRAEQRDFAALGDESVIAATYVACVAAQGGPAWFLHDVLSVSAQGAGSGIYVPESLLRYSVRLGLDISALDACMADPAVAESVRKDTAAGRAAGITAAPTVVIRKGDEEAGRFVAPLDVAKVVAAIDAAR